MLWNITKFHNSCVFILSLLNSLTSYNVYQTILDTTGSDHTGWSKTKQHWCWSLYYWFNKKHILKMFVDKLFLKSKRVLFGPVTTMSPSFKNFIILWWYPYHCIVQTPTQFLLRLISSLTAFIMPVNNTIYVLTRMCKNKKIFNDIYHDPIWQLTIDCCGNMLTDNKYVV